MWQPSPNIARWNMSMGDASSLQFPQFLSLGVKKETESKDLCKIYMWWCSSLSVSFSKQLALLMDTVTHIYFCWGNCFQFQRMSEAIHVISTRSEIQFGSYQLNAFQKTLKPFWDDGHLVIPGDTPCPHPSNCLTYKQTNSATLFMGTDKWISYLYVKTLHLLW